MTRGAPARTATAQSDAAGSTVSVLPIGQEQVGGLSGGGRAGQDVAVQRLAEHDGGRLQDAAAVGAWRVVLAGPDPRQCVRHRGPGAAADADDGVHGAVQLEYPVTARPARWCRPSMFWVITRVSMPLAASRARARCAYWARRSRRDALAEPARTAAGLPGRRRRPGRSTFSRRPDLGSTGRTGRGSPGCRNLSRCPRR